MAQAGCNNNEWRGYFWRFFGGLRDVGWVGCREAWGRREGGVLAAQVLTYKWASKQHTMLT